MKLAYIALPVAASVFIAGAVVVALWMIGSASGERAKFSSLEIAPRDTDVFFAINTDPTSPEWLAVNDSLDQINAKNAIREAIDEALAEVNLDWERDIVPVAGDEAFFSIPDISNVDQEDPGWVGGVLLSDEDHAREVFDKLRAQEDATPLEEEQYNGVTIYFSEPSNEPIFGGDSGPAYECDIDGDVMTCTLDGVVCDTFDFNATPTPVGVTPTPLPDECANFFGSPGDGFTSGSFDVASSAAIAFVDNVMVLGANPDAAKSVIDVVQGRADSAQKNERLQEFRAQQKQDFLVWGYSDLADVWAQAEGSLPFPFDEDSGFDSEAALDTARKTYDRVGFSLSSHSDGFTFDLTVLHAPDFNPDDAFEPTSTYEPRIAEILPPDTMFYLSSFDLYSQSWLPAKDAFSDVELAGEHDLDYYLDEFRDKTGLDIEADLLSLFTGELAVAGNVSDFDGEPPDVSVFGIADVNDPGKADSTIQSLEEYLEDEGEIAASVDGAVHTWEFEDEDGNVESVDWVVRDGRVVVAYPVGAQDSLVSGAGSLAETEDWKKTMELLPADKTFVGYLSLARVIEEVRNMRTAEQDFEDSTGGKVTLEDLDAIRSLGMAGTSNEHGFGLHIVLFLEER